MATVSNHHVNTCLDGFRRQGGDASLLLTVAGINPRTLYESDERIHVEQVARLFRLVQQEMDDEFMGFTRVPCKFGAFSTFCSLTARCRTLGELLEGATNFYNILTQDLTIRLDATDSRTVMSFSLANPKKDDKHFLAEFLLVIWHRFSSWYIGQHIRLSETHFTNKAPEHLSELKIMYPGKLKFGKPVHALMFEKGALDRKLIRKSSELREFLQFYPLELMTVPNQENWFEYKVQQQLMSHVDQVLIFPDANVIASELGIGKLTMYRKLKKEGTTFQRTTENIRREKAIDLLIHTELTIDQISEFTGYSEPRSFSRAFRSWTGSPPSKYRRSYKSARSNSDL